uniref:COP9 signalosome complex subunit 6 n=1 Tax=Tetraselmis sp. GSL018 TaxID=582737 RepID=A0A061R6C1_9CHLO
METPKQSSSGLEFKLHPLVLVNISDHHTRTKLNSRVIEPNSGTVPVLGCLLGLHTGLTVEITNSFEVLHEVKDGVLVPDSAFLTTKQDQYKRVFPSLDVVGWYTTGEAPREEHLSTHKMMMDINESPVFLLLNPAPSASSKDLPIALYESELHVVDGANTLKLSCANYNIEVRATADPCGGSLSSGKRTRGESEGRAGRGERGEGGAVAPPPFPAVAKAFRPRFVLRPWREGRARREAGNRRRPSRRPSLRRRSVSGAEPRRGIGARGMEERSRFSGVSRAPPPLPAPPSPHPAAGLMGLGPRELTGRSEAAAAAPRSRAEEARATF